MRRIVFLSLVICFSALAQLQAPPRVGVSHGKHELTLGKAIELALAKNLEIEIERTGIESSVEAIRGAKGFLDPNFRFAPRYENRTTPTSSALMGTDGKLKETFGTADVSYDQRLPWWGLGFRLAYDSSRATTTNPFTSLSPFTMARLSATMTLPLVRNHKIDPQRAHLKISSKRLDISSVQFETKVTDVITRVEEAYWNLVAARQNVEVTSEAVKLGREQLARTKRMIASGTLPPVEVAAAEAELERRVDTWYASIGLVTRVENALKQLITGSREESLWNEEIIPTNQQMLNPPPVEKVREAVLTALRKRPELRRVGLQLESNTIEQTLARDQTRPQVNLTGGYVSAGLAGRFSGAGNPFTEVLGSQFRRVNELSAFHDLEPIEIPKNAGPPAGQIGGISEVWNAIVHSRYPTAFVGVEFQWTPRNRAATAQYAQTAIAERRLKLERDRLEQAIEAQVRNSLQAIQTARQRITASEASARAAEEKLKSEIRLFRSGESTNFLVLTRQNELSDSRRRAVVARLDFNKAVAYTQQALGTTLEAHDIELDTPVSLKGR